MKKINYLVGFLLLSVAPLCWVSCNDDKEEDRIEIVTMTVDSETADKVYSPFLTNTTVLGEFLKVKENNDSEWRLFELYEIGGFRYLDGHSYQLEVKKTYLSNPPADGSSTTYTLIKVLSDRQVDESIASVRRFYMGKCFALVKGEKLTEKEKQEIEAKILANMPANRIYKLIATDKNALTGTLEVYIDDTKKEGTFAVQKAGSETPAYDSYEFNVAGKQNKLIFSKATRTSVMPQYGLLEDLTDAYKTDYPNVEQAYAQQIVLMMK